MRTYLKYFLYSLCLSSTLFASDFPGNIEVNLKEPIFSNGILQTDQGGVITSQEIRIQAQKITYTNRTESGHKIMTLIAEGDLLFEYGDKVFSGSRLEYDFIQNKGSLLEGRTVDGLWVIGGSRIDFEGKGNYAIYNAFVTTDESKTPSWEIAAKSVELTENSLIKCSQIQFKFFNTPLLWLPSFKSNLANISNPPIRYKVIWDKMLAPRISTRYRIFSWEDFNLFLRLDYRITRGPGGAIESEYFSGDERTTFITRSYGAFDKAVPDEHGWKRYRLQGLFHHES